MTFAGTAYGRPRVAGQTGRAITGRHLFARTAAPHSAAADAVGHQIQAGSSIGRALSSKVSGWGFKSLPVCQSTWREDAPKLRQNAKVA